MSASKLERATNIVGQILKLEKEIGSTVPARGSAKRLSKLVEIEGQWRARVTRGQRVAFAPVYGPSSGAGATVFGERWIEDSKWLTIQLETIRGSVFVVNVRKDEVELFRYVPGKWEGWFGIEPTGDTVTYEAVHFPRPGSTEVQELLKSPDAQLPPLRTGRGHEEDMRGRFFHTATRGRAWPGQPSQFPPAP